MSSEKEQVTSTVARVVTIIGWCAVALIATGAIGLLIAVRVP